LTITGKTFILSGAIVQKHLIMLIYLDKEINH